MKRHRSETFEHTISGLLTKRADMFKEASEARARLAELRNDIEALDRTLRAFGYTGDLDAAMPRARREVMFGRGELTRAILGELRDADGPLGSREIAQGIVELQGYDAKDRGYVTQLTRRVSKALRILKQSGAVRSAPDKRGNLLWSRA
jgi:hypothetical protein